jgi:hypothetical protein
MKLLVNEELVWQFNFADNPEIDRDEYKDGVQDLADLAKSMSVWGSFTVDEASARIVINAQKINLDGIAMNQLFFELLTQLFEIELAYAPLGGAGCDFAMEIAKATPKY